ncbi:hypothetical protein MKW94_009252 [Papaver nudicaule]|uniref:SUN domain-containing protein n=1 Tax=Papaver nudicaule TaxID=74823 RepID=A0AA42B1F7_PAPNU|nr:hypothetical protein [Papaver nudicaule]
MDSNSPYLTPGSRRRTVTVMENKSSHFEMVEEGGGGGGVFEPVRNEGGKDLSHTIRGESTLDRERNLSSSLQVKKGHSTISPRRKKVASRTPEKPFWKTLLSVLIKNFLLLLILGGFVQMIWILALKSGDSSEISGQIAEVEKFIDSTTKMMQIQVEVVERKIQSEVGGLRKEFTKKVEEKGAKYETELKKLEAKADELGKSFGELKGSGILTKEDFDKFFVEFMKNNAEGSEKELSLDDIRAFAKEVIEKEIEKHAADGLGMVDYALASGGGRVLGHSEPFTHTKGSGWLPFKNQYGVHQDAQRVLEPSFGEPGKCFPLQGRNGYVVIKLRTTIISEAVTVEHVSKSVAYDRSSAPKDCRVSGWYKKYEPNACDGADLSSQDPKKVFVLSEFVYDLDRSNAQTFKVDSGEKRIINTVRFDFDSNHGASHLCIYRLRVHGHEPAISESEL